MSSAAAASPAVASSSKRAAPTTPATPAANKRARTDMSEAPEDDDEPINEEDMDDESKAKAARREARTIRNRESAQRSRNQRKAHLSWLEARVVELENENRALRTGGTAPSTPCKTRESSPANSIVSLASDLGIPPEIVSAGGGVNLATVAPPPADVDIEDIKPRIPTSVPDMISIATPQLSIMEQAPSTDLATENMHLRWRVSMLENIVKQAAAYFSSNTPIDMATAPPPHPMMEVHTPSPPRIAGMDATLSPPLFPTLREPVQSPLRLQTKLDTTNNMTHPDTNQSTASADVVSSFIDLSTPVARHPAVVATLPAVSSERRGGDRGVGASSRLDLGVAGSFGADSRSAQDVGSSQDAWFPEGTQAHEWDEEMNDLLETLEGQPDSVSKVVPGNVGVSPAMTGDQWAWETAMVEF
ncbi:uncharacterized protein EHS24_000563 [Apiotrichum porosum]|uniref:BZIP domain-containing protein n=1 Tax=Apiotrichum porosum TaxID=105984 RepID=A0A427YAC7_9TREE|nr:uncharacterized protein EHS24_000563 [Apiotrichum porosum]RSH88038.1 hypothetical protein EHS24_000563 [Apiotrichum porosum]